MKMEKYELNSIILLLTDISLANNLLQQMGDDKKKCREVPTRFFFKPLFPNVSDILKPKVSIKLHVSTISAVWQFYEFEADPQ